MMMMTLRIFEVTIIMTRMPMRNVMMISATMTTKMIKKIMMTITSKMMEGSVKPGGMRPRWDLDIRGRAAGSRHCISI